MSTSQENHTFAQTSISQCLHSGLFHTPSAVVFILIAVLNIYCTIKVIFYVTRDLNLLMQRALHSPDGPLCCLSAGQQERTLKTCRNTEGSCITVKREGTTDILNVSCQSLILFFYNVFINKAAFFIQILSCFYIKLFEYYIYKKLL